MNPLLFLCILVVIIVLYLLCLKPNNTGKARMKAYEKVYIAHRGLFDKAEAPENSLAAFRRAVNGGYGIELDVQLTADGKLVVFHDESLKRMCGVARKVWKCNYRELCQYHLLDTQEKIPLLEEVLQVVAGKVPMIIEIKPEGNSIRTAKALSGHMKKYQGEYCVESFDPRVLHWYRKNDPEIVRGQLSTNFWLNESDKPWYIKIGLTNLLTNFYTKPDFIAYNYKYANQLSLQICRHFYHTELVAWTVHSPEELEQARESFRVFIFDGFIPAEKA
ncbi:MAG: glycerophosphodiester phosphodiesterase [Lachnospiraceae bacterium]|nr:glycerophosphodiester phosphodiesterase [Lachnospiraceae bacterium]